MIIDAISPVPSAIEAPTKTSSFQHWLADSLQQTNRELHQADQALESLARGDSAHLHQVMLQLESAKLSLQLIEQVRSRALSAYQDMMKEQI
ncbi:MAG: flagellar hook-basal body complex protein FliE [Legionellaceae bacterium]|nr:flagellar hook-basal body complex protein FliE [Legionellaceae bacterium]